MTRSTVEPKPIRLWKIKPTNKGIQLDLSAHWNMHQITVEDDRETHQEWEYDELRFEVSYEGARDAVNTWLVSQEARILLIAKTLWEAQNGKQALTVDEQKTAIDSTTGDTISTIIHPFCGIDEQIGIIRDQLVRILNGDMTATDDFKRLNEIATAAVEEGAAKKVAL